MNLIIKSKAEKMQREEKSHDFGLIFRRVSYNIRVYECGMKDKKICPNI